LFFRSKSVKMTGVPKFDIIFDIIRYLECNLYLNSDHFSKLNYNYMNDSNRSVESSNYATVTPCCVSFIFCSSDFPNLVQPTMKDSALLPSDVTQFSFILNNFSTSVYWTEVRSRNWPLTYGRLYITLSWSEENKDFLFW